MKIFTSHARPGEPPVLLREGFSWAGFFFGFLYLAVHRAWIQAALNLAALLLVLSLSRAIGNAAPTLGLAILQGVFARDLLRWSFSQRGFVDGPVVAASDHDQALGRLIDSAQHLAPHTAGAAL